MSVKCTKRTKKIQFSENDYVVIRPLTHDEMNSARSVLKNSEMLSQFLDEMGKLLDRDPNKEINEKFEENLEKIKEFDENKMDYLKEYNNMLIESSIVEVMDDGEKEEDIKTYLNDIDFITYETIMRGIIELCSPNKEESDFLEEGQEKLPE